MFPWDPPVQLYNSMRELVDGLGVEACREEILKHVVKGKYEVKDIPRGTSSDPLSGVCLHLLRGLSLEYFLLKNRMRCSRKVVR